MATQGPAPGELLCVDELERKLIDLSEQVKIKKEEARSNFQQLHGLLVVRETFLLREMEEIVIRARQAITEKRICNNCTQPGKVPKETSLRINYKDYSRSICVISRTKSEKR